MSLEQLTEQVKSQAQQLATLGYKVKFDVEDEGAILVDGTAMPVTVENEDTEADCTISLSAANLEKLIDGDLSPTLAYTLGQIKVDGSLGVAMKLASLLES
ncbi:MAG: SCP2 sterol-binding domain-containing protein [Alphaproteobacteria bacterium]|nr:SCP2 sterol-binding domain-containing protein [Alphaproteobacteria bacterium]